jgi:mRNA-degrading endonuclease RelE of RelBE toxin-antitoxin system
MPYTVKLKKSAGKELEHLPARIHDKIIRLLLSLKERR